MSGEDITLCNQVNDASRAKDTVGVTHGHAQHSLETPIQKCYKRSSQNECDLRLLYGMANEQVKQDE